MIKIIAVNGSPRKKWNTGTMLQHFIEGARSAGDDVQVEIIHLYDYKFKGCTSCLVCQQKSDARGHCTVRDEVTPLIDEVALADGVVFGSPIYMASITSQLKAFLERLVFQYVSFDTQGLGTTAPKKLQTAMIYTMNFSEEAMKSMNYPVILGALEMFVGLAFGNPPQSVYACNTYQYTDYQKYVAGFWNEPEKAAYRQKQFPLDCRKAFEAGREMVEKIRSQQ